MINYTDIIDWVLIFITIFEQILSYLPQGYPHSTVQLIIYIIIKPFTLFKRKNHKDIVVLNEV